MPKLSLAKYSLIYKTVLIKKVPYLISMSRFKMTDLKGESSDFYFNKIKNLMPEMICNSQIVNPEPECPSLDTNVGKNQ